MTSKNLARPMKKREIVINFDGKCGGKHLRLDIMSFLCLTDIQLRMQSIQVAIRNQTLGKRSEMTDADGIPNHEAR